MTIQRNWTRAAFVTGGVAVLAVASLTWRARAAGIPTSGLTYAGTLTSATGEPLAGEHNVRLQFWAAASGGNPVCQMPSAEAIELAAGKFSVTLPEACTNAVRNNPNLWVEAEVDGTALGRAKVGAVPFAIEAGRSATADAASGSLETRLAALEAGKVNGAEGAKPLRICRGSTPAGNTAWRVYNTHIAVTVDISACKFATKPTIVSSLAGRTNHWVTTGGSNPYTPATAPQNAFDIFVKYIPDFNPASVTPAEANEREWHIEWIAVGN